jgi:hypothetical protein
MSMAASAAFSAASEERGLPLLPEVIDFVAIRVPAGPKPHLEKRSHAIFT